MRCLESVSLSILLALVPLCAMAQHSASPLAAYQRASVNPWMAVDYGVPDSSVWAMGGTSDDSIAVWVVEWDLLSFDAGLTWLASREGPPEHGVTSVAFDLNRSWYVGTLEKGVFKSEDAGSTWQEMSEGLQDVAVGALLVDQKGELYASTVLGPLYHFDADAATWEPIHDVGLDNPFMPALAVDENNTLFRGTDGGVYRSSDGGATWEEASKGLTNLHIESLEVGVDGMLYAGTDGGVFRSIDKGEAWEEVDNEVLGAYNIRAMAVNAENALFAGTHGAGVYRSLDAGASWEALNDGLASRFINAFHITPKGTMYAGTADAGLFRRDAATDVSTEYDASIVNAVTLAPNYPNPFIGSTRIRYALPKSTDVFLAVYDVQGRLVEVLSTGTKPAGWHEHRFDGAHLPSGIYFYRLRAGDFTAMRNFVLLR